MMQIHQFDVWVADLNPRIGTETGKVRPVVVLQTNLLNDFHPSTIVCPISTNVHPESDLLRVHLAKGTAGLSADSDILIDQTKAIDNKRLQRKIGELPADVAQKIRQNITLIFDLQFMLLPFFQEQMLEAGCDEAGRGCLAGPVFAAAVILPKDFYHPLLNDSKKLSEEQRYALRPVIQTEAIAFGVAQLNHTQIDRLNILNASFKAMHLAVKQLSVQPQLLLIDGNRFNPYKKLSHQCIIGGDGKYASIAAASILAKTYRDDCMKVLHQKHPRYNWAQNKGYATLDHQAALNEFGPCRYHRQSFRLDYKKPMPVAELPA